MNMSNGRKHLKNAMVVVEQRIVEKELSTCCVLPCGYGKSDLARSLAYDLRRKGLISITLHVNPGSYLIHQIISEVNIKEWVNRYDIKLNRDSLFLCSAITDIDRNFGYVQNQETMLTVTIQLVTKNKEHFIKFLRLMRIRTGKPCLLVLDECQFTRYVKKWGATINEIQKASGCHILALTATPYSRDNERIVGITYVEVVSESVLNYYSIPDESGETERYGLQETEVTYRAEPHYRVSRRDAFEEGAVCKINYGKIKIQFEDGKRFENFSKEEARRRLGALVKDRGYNRHALDKAISELNVYKAIDQRVSMIVFCLPDTEGCPINWHAMQIMELIKEIDRSKSVLIINSNESEANEQLKDFCEGRLKVDIIIVKSMGEVGVSAPHLKVAVDLSNVRTLNSFVQRGGRISRPFMGCNQCHWYTCDDPWALEMINKVIEEDDSGICIEIIEGDVFVVIGPGGKGTPGKDHNKYDRQYNLFGLTYDLSVQDTDNEFVEGMEKLEMIAHLRSILPELTKNLSDAQIWKFVVEIKQCGSEQSKGQAASTICGAGQSRTSAKKEVEPELEPEQQEEEVEEESQQIFNIGREVKRLRDETNEIAKEIVSKQLNWKKGDDNELFRDEIRKLYRRVNDVVGVPIQLRSNLRNIELLKRVHKEMKRIKESMGL